METNNEPSCDIKFGAVAIGRNEGNRLRQCLQSLAPASVTVYVDSGSSDGSVGLARDLGVDVVQLDLSMPFTAARARNAGFRRLCQLAPDIAFVQFVDGDCEVQRNWHKDALKFLQSRADVAVVCGRRRERFPERSIYNWLCDREWEGRVGEVRACGGDAMMRSNAIEGVGGYRDDLVAGEEPELCVRLRQTAWKIWRLPVEMTLHDAAMTRFTQWWRRAVRAGYAFAQGSHLHGAPPERHWVWESRRAWIWGVWLPLVGLLIGLAYGSWAWLLFLVYPAQVMRQVMRNQGSIGDRMKLALYQVLSRFPEGWGQIKFLLDRLVGSRSRLIEYK